MRRLLAIGVLLLPALAFSPQEALGYHSPELAAAQERGLDPLFLMALIGFALSSFYPLSLVLLLVVGLGSMGHINVGTVMMQLATPPHLQGRVMSLFFMVFMGTPPVGSLLAGVLAPHIGAPLTVALTGVCCLGGAAWFASRVHLLREADAAESGVVD
ncbi:MAG: MFS transporter [Meiothermus silvanus]|nr:MFS transporter [Allomeiothermus silvanus]